MTGMGTLSSFRELGEMGPHNAVGCGFPALTRSRDSMVLADL
jgi:hypothetical protein